MRLTERKVCFPRCDKQGNLTKVDYIEIKNKKLAEEKLCQLEDIEEELGIELITLFKALKNGIYTTVYKNYVFGDELTIDMRRKAFSFKEYECSTIACFKDYGKTWSLDKSDLEKKDD